MQECDDTFVQRRCETRQMRDFKKIIAWQKAHRLSVSIHLTANESRWRVSPGWRSQLLRSVAAVPAHISEGSGARTDAEFARYLDVALKSAREVEHLLIFARDLNAIDHDWCERRIQDADEVRRIVFSLARAVRKRGNLSDRDRW